MKLSTVFAVALLSASPALAQSRAWVVAQEFGPGVDAIEIGDAVDLASDGDLILVRSGAYDPFEVVGKSLTIQGDPSAAVMPEFQDEEPETAVTIVGLAANQSVTLNDLVLFQFGSGPNPLIDVRDCSGPVTFENIFGDFLGGFTALEVADSSSVTVSNSHIQVSILEPESGPATDAPAIDALRSNVFVHESTIFGATGHGAVQQHATVLPPSDGAPGARLIGSSLTLAGSFLGGGNGGSAFGLCGLPGAGGAGVVMDADGLLGSSLLLQDSAPFGGFGGGASGECGFAPGPMGEDFEIVAGTIQVVPGSTRDFGFASPVIEGAALSSTFNGQDGDLVFLLIGTEPLGGTFVAGLASTLHTAPFLISNLGALTGPSETFVFTAPALAATTDFLKFHTQAAFLGTGGDFYLAGPSMTVIVNDSL